MREEGFRRLHPLTPVLRGWKIFAAAVALAVQQTFGGLSLGYLLLAFEVAALQAAVGDHDESRTDPTHTRGADARGDETAGRSEPGATRA